MPKVSIIIPTFNCEAFISEAIESALKQTYQDFEIIVIDDGSTDQTKSTVEKFVQKFYPDKIRYIYQNNQGLAMARNRGIQESRGEMIALLDADDKWYPNRLEEGLKVIESDPDIGLVHANICRISEEGRELYIPERKMEYLSGKMFENIFLRKADIACPTVLFRKFCCARVGMFDKNLTRLGCEDRELWLRIAHEFKIVYIDKVLAYYRMRSSSMSHHQEKMLKARQYVVDKFYPEGSNVHLRTQALSKIYKDLGDEMLLREEFGAARQQYKKSLSYLPFSFWTWVNLTKAFFKVKVKSTE